MHTSDLMPQGWMNQSEKKKKIKKVRKSQRAKLIFTFKDTFTKEGPAPSQNWRILQFFAHHVLSFFEQCTEMQVWNQKPLRKPTPKQFCRAAASKFIFSLSSLSMLKATAKFTQVAEQSPTTSGKDAESTIKPFHSRRRKLCCTASSLPHRPQ